MGKSKAKDETLKQKPLPVARESKDETTERGIARTVLRPSINHALTVANVLRRDYGERGLIELSEELAAQCAAVSKGDLGGPEALLTAQAHTLDALFNHLTRLAYGNWDNLGAAERLLRLAFKAQTQSRATVETLGNLRNPPMVIARQANIAHGPQQVNNGFDSSTRTHAQARETQSEPNKLLGQTHGERLDTGATGQAVASDTAMATVGALHRPEDGGG